MRIVHVIDYFQPAVGYQETYIAQAQQAAGHEVHVVTSDRYYPFPDYDANAGAVLGPRLVGPGTRVEHGLTVHRLPVALELPAIAQVVIRWLPSKIASLRPDIVNCDGVLSYQAWRIAALQSRLGFGLVYDNHAADFNTNLHDTLPKHLAAITYRRLVVPRIRRAAGVIAAVGEAQRSFVCRELGLSEAEVPVLPLGADTERFRPDDVIRRRTRESLALDEATPLLVHAGKLTPNKDVHVLVEAFGRAFPSGPARLLLIGGGDRDYLARLRRVAEAAGVADRLIWRPFLPAAELVPYFNGADLGVWPGDHSNVIEEAVACGLPVVVPDYFAPTAPGAYLVANENGRTFERGNVSALASVLMVLVGERDLLRAMRARSRELAERAFSYRVVTNEFLRLYELAIERARRRKRTPAVARVATVGRR